MATVALAGSRAAAAAMATSTSASTKWVAAHTSLCAGAGSPAAHAPLAAPCSRSSPIPACGEGSGASLRSAFLGSASPVPNRFSTANWSGSGGCASRGVRSQAAAVDTADSSTKLRPGTWEWRDGDEALKIHFVEHVKSGGYTSPVRDVLFLTTISDVSYTGEWSAVVRDLVSRDGGSWRAVVVDWPGLGDSDRPPLEYSYDIMERFLREFVSASDGPLASSAKDEAPIIVGAGHGASIAVKAVSNGVIKASAVAAVAPTWAGPLPIVFGRDSTMEGRYGALRGTIRSPGVGWAMYRYVLSSRKNIKLQYLTHVYAEADNVSPAVIEKGVQLTQKDGARYAPAAFLTGQLDPTRSREEFISLFAELDGKVPTLVVSSRKSPRRSKAEMEALQGVKGVTKYVEVPGALLPQEEYPKEVADELFTFLSDLSR